MRRAALTLTLLLAATALAAQETTAPSSYAEAERQAAAASGADEVPAPPSATPAAPAASAGLSYSATEAQRAQLGEALYADHQAALDYNRRVFEWQMVSTQVSFFVVIGLVVSGLIFAAIQFRRGMIATQGNPDFNTDLELTAKGLKVSSPVLGVVVLAISLGFFYLYLAHVYPIEYARNAVPPPVATPSAD